MKQIQFFYKPSLTSSLRSSDALVPFSESLPRAPKFQYPPLPAVAEFECKKK